MSYSTVAVPTGDKIYPLTLTDITYTYYEYNNTKKPKEETMSLVDKYKQTPLSDDEKYARKVGAIDDKGRLTVEGRNLLVEMLFEDMKIRDEFYKVLKSLQNDD